MKWAELEAFCPGNSPNFEGKIFCSSPSRNQVTFPHKASAFLSHYEVINCGHLLSPSTLLAYIYLGRLVSPVNYATVDTSVQKHYYPTRILDFPFRTQRHFIFKLETWQWKSVMFTLFSCLSFDSYITNSTYDALNGKTIMNNEL
jgi:hypothetical protein